VAENLAILVVIATLAGAFVLVLLNTLWRMEGRAHWSREAGIRRSQRRELHREADRTAGPLSEDAIHRPLYRRSRCDMLFACNRPC